MRQTLLGELAYTPGLDPLSQFPNSVQEVWLEVGFGAGEHLVWQAAQHPQVGLIGAEPVRAQKIDFSTAYVEIEATYLVPAGSGLKHASEVDRPGNRIAVSARSAYDLWLTRNIQHAQLLHAEGFEATLALFVEQKLEAMAALKPGLLGDVARLPGSRILEGNFTTVQQSIGVPKGRLAAATYLQSFVDEIKTALVAQLITKHQVKGLSVAP